MGLSKFFLLIWFLSKERGLTSCFKIAPISCLEALHSTINVFGNSGVAKIGVVHMASLSFSKFWLFHKSKKIIPYLIMLLEVLILDHSS
jgi:hypothetical protein